MRATLLSSAAILFSIADASGGSGQTAAEPMTTRILAVGTFDPGVDLAAVQAILPEEVRETTELYLDGRIDQWFSLRDRNGVVFILNGSDVGAAAAMLERLPLGRAHLMRFDLMPLGPLEPLRRLQGMAKASP